MRRADVSAPPPLVLGQRGCGRRGVGGPPDCDRHGGPPRRRPPPLSGAHVTPQFFHPDGAAGRGQRQCWGRCGPAVPSESAIAAQQQRWGGGSATRFRCARRLCAGGCAGDGWRCWYGRHGQHGGHGRGCGRWRDGLQRGHSAAAALPPAAGGHDERRQQRQQPEQLPQRQRHLRPPLCRPALAQPGRTHAGLTTQRPATRTHAPTTARGTTTTTAASPRPFPHPPGAPGGPLPASSHGVDRRPGWRREQWVAALEGRQRQQHGRQWQWHPEPQVEQSRHASRHFA
mmetsp:Transcript_51256/g.128742  ORF Transcript_51256/g.128742 Transcript_51256/m.128742 type:complete len:286 (+) Transcript_51256:1650-2507(+)